jgi:parallel beta-helix repeat protein
MSRRHPNRRSWASFATVALLAPLLAAPSPSPVGGLTTAADCPSGSIEIPVSDTTQMVQAKLAQPGTGRTFCWEPGVHRIHGPLRMHPGDTFVGITDENGTLSVIDGSRTISRWRRVAPFRWVASVRGLHPPPLNLVPGLRCIDGTDHCAYPDDVFWRDRRLRRVWSLRDQGRGSYFVDYPGDRIYVGRDPSLGAVSRAVPLPVVDGRSQPLIAAKAGTMVRDLVVQKVGVGIQGAAIRGAESTIANVVVRLAHGRGFSVDDLSSVTGSTATSNGQGGIGIGRHAPGSTGAGGLIQGNSVVHNGWIRCFGVCAGIKASYTDGIEIRANDVQRTVGPGIWIDNSSINYVIEDNVVVDSQDAGIETEISYDGVISRNTITGSMQNPLHGTVSIGAIHVLASGSCSWNCPSIPNPGVTISGNIVGTAEDPNVFGIVLRQVRRGSGSYGEHIVRDVAVRDNVVTFADGWNGAVDSSEAIDIYTTRNNTFQGNDYRLQGPSSAVFRWESGGRANAWLTFEQWQAAGNDTMGTLL